MHKVEEHNVAEHHLVRLLHFKSSKSSHKAEVKYLLALKWLPQGFGWWILLLMPWLGVVVRVTATTIKSSKNHFRKKTCPLSESLLKGPFTTMDKSIPTFLSSGPGTESGYWKRVKIPWHIIQSILPKHGHLLRCSKVGDYLKINNALGGASRGRSWEEIHQIWEAGRIVLKQGLATLTQAIKVGYWEACKCSFCSSLTRFGIIGAAKSRSC